jgi:putative membrane protein
MNMSVVANAAVIVVACLHLLFMVLESFLWTKPAGRRIFGLSAEKAAETASLALNQGLYNGFLAAGLIWSVFDAKDALGIKVFFLSCVIIAGIVGAITAKRSILWIQAMPAAVALLLVYLSR